MKTLEQVMVSYKQKALDGRDIHRLLDFISEEKWENFGYSIKEEAKGTHVPQEWTRENILEQLKHDVSFGFEKALDQRGLSADFMFRVVKMWNWILEEGLEDFSDDDYAMYGLPLFKATAVKYGFNNPIGENSGSESQYDCD